jgi:cell division transport system permease protein
MAKSSTRRRPRRQTGGALLRGYFVHHWATLHQSLLRLWADRLQSSLTAMVVAIAMALPAALYLTVENIAALAPPLEQPARLSVYVEVAASSEQLTTLRSRLAARPEVAEIDYISADQALAELAASASFAAALDQLPSNPLPALYELTLNLTAIAAGESTVGQPTVAQQLEVLRAELAALPAVAEVVLDSLWLQRLRAIIDLAKQLLAGLALVLLLGVVVVIGNTVKMAIDHRREEIVVVKLVGGTDAYVRRPFIYAGALYGLVGAALALAALWLATAVLNAGVTDLASLYQSQFVLRGPTLVEALLLLATGIGVGVVAAYFAVAGQLRAIAPN